MAETPFCDGETRTLTTVAAVCNGELSGKNIGLDGLAAATT
jgi:hypothetical protein